MAAPSLEPEIVPASGPDWPKLGLTRGLGTSIIFTDEGKGCISRRCRLLGSFGAG